MTPTIEALIISWLPQVQPGVNYELQRLKVPDMYYEQKEGRKLP
jgi:hypothetical protein